MLSSSVNSILTEFYFISIFRRYIRQRRRSRKIYFVNRRLASLTVKSGPGAVASGPLELYIKTLEKSNYTEPPALSDVPSKQER